MSRNPSQLLSGGRSGSVARGPLIRFSQFSGGLDDGWSAGGGGRTMGAAPGPPRVCTGWARVRPRRLRRSRAETANQPTTGRAKRMMPTIVAMISFSGYSSRRGSWGCRPASPPMLSRIDVSACTFLSL